MATTLEPSVATTATTPIVVDLGKHGRKRVKALRDGKGPLLAEIAHCIEELQAAGTIGVSAQPVVVIVRQRRRKRLAWPLG